MLRVLLLLLTFSSAAFAQFQRPSAAYAPLFSEWHLLTGLHTSLSMSSCCFQNQQNMINKNPCFPPMQLV